VDDEESNVVHSGHVRGEAALALMRWQNDAAPPTAQTDVSVAWLVRADLCVIVCTLEHSSA
jgi:hypothetical protein